MQLPMILDHFELLLLQLLQSHILEVGKNHLMLAGLVLEVDVVFKTNGIRVNNIKSSLLYKYLEISIAGVNYVFYLAFLNSNEGIFHLNWKII